LKPQECVRVVSFAFRQHLWCDMRADRMSTETTAIETARRDAYLSVLVEFRTRLHNHWHDSLKREAAEAEHLAGKLEKHWADFTAISFREPNQALEEDRAALRKAADVLRAYAEALRS
jgi:exonuclease VII large subunit